MSLAKDFSEANVKLVRCSTCKALGALTGADRDAFVAALANHDLSVRLIVEVCAKNGIEIGRASVSAHRQGRCPKP
jgi:hypothetical protein